MATNRWTRRERSPYSMRYSPLWGRVASSRPTVPLALRGNQPRSVVDGVGAQSQGQSVLNDLRARQVPAADLRLDPPVGDAVLERRRRKRDVAVLAVQDDAALHGQLPAELGTGVGEEQPAARG